MLQEADDVLAFKPSRLGHGCYMTDAQVMFLRFAYVLVVLFMFVTCDINQVLTTISFFVTLYQLHFAQQHGLPLEVHAPFSLDIPFPRAAKPHSSSNSFTTLHTLPDLPNLQPLHHVTPYSPTRCSQSPPLENVTFFSHSRCRRCFGL